MVIVIDSKNPFLADVLAPHATVRSVPTTGITRQTLRDADAVIVRSETSVGPGLLDGTPVRFVGTATIGTDHVDTAYLGSRGIRFAAAPGSNAESVAQYVAAALLVARQRLQRDLRGLTLGVVGAGNVGKRVARVGAALGMRVLLNDPPLARMTGDPRYLPVDALMEADIITLHVPLTMTGQDATHHLWDAVRIGGMKEGSILVNTSRGAVVDTAALHDAIGRGHLAAALLDVWEGEPAIDAGLLGRTMIGTPHIAGYSYDGKVNAARMMFQALAGTFGLSVPWPADLPMPPPSHAFLTVDASGDAHDAVRTIVSRCYDIQQDDERLRASIAAGPEERAAAFRALRAGYPVRREFSATTVDCSGGMAEVAEILRGLGFRIPETA